jgi:hypothetical protein
VPASPHQGAVHDYTFCPCRPVLTILEHFEDFRLEKGRLSDEDLQGEWLVLSHLLDETVDQLTGHDYTKIGTIVTSLHG